MPKKVASVFKSTKECDDFMDYDNDKHKAGGATTSVDDVKYKNSKGRIVCMSKDEKKRLKEFMSEYEILNQHYDGIDSLRRIASTVKKGTIEAENAAS